MGELIQEAGGSAYLVLLLGFVGLPVGIGGLVLSVVTRAFRPALVLAGLSLGLGLMTLSLAYGDRAAARSGSLKAVAHAAPEDRAIILEGSYAESNAIVKLGALTGLPLLLLATGAFGAAFARTGSRP